MDESQEVAAAVQAIRSLISDEDPVVRFKRLTALLAGWPDLTTQVRAMRQEAGEELYRGDRKLTFAQIGQLIGVTESRARHIVMGITNPSRQKRRAQPAAADEDG